MGLVSRRPTGLWWTEGSHTDSHTLGPSTKAALWKAPGRYVKETLSFEHGSVGRGLRGCSAGRGLAGAIFLFSLGLAAAGRCRLLLLFFFIVPFLLFSLFLFLFVFSLLSVSTMFSLSLCHAPECQYLSEGSVNTHLAPWVLWLPCLVLEAGAVGCVPGYHRTVTIGETVLGRLPPPGHCTEDWHTPSLSVEEVYLLVLLGGRLQVCTHLEDTEVLSGNIGQERQLCALPLPHYSSPVSPRKELVSPSGTPVFVTAAQGTPQEHPALGATRAYGPIGPYIFAFFFFLSCYLKVWLSISLNLGAD